LFYCLASFALRILARRACTWPHFIAPPVLFRMKGIAHAYEPLSAGFDVTSIKKELKEMGYDLNCDIDLKDL
jgi:hypothetical protein